MEKLKTMNPSLSINQIDHSLSIILIMKCQSFSMFGVQHGPRDCHFRQHMLCVGNGQHWQCFRRRMTMKRTWWWRHQLQNSQHLRPAWTSWAVLQVCFTLGCSSVLCPQKNGWIVHTCPHKTCLQTDFSQDFHGKRWSSHIFTRMSPPWNKSIVHSAGPSRRGLCKGGETRMTTMAS